MPLNLPNLITLLRILLIPLIVGIFYLPDAWLSFEGKNIAATAIFVFAAVTDWLDGYLARKLDQMSAFGAFFDPVADKLVVVGALVVLLQLNRVDMVAGNRRTRLRGRCDAAFAPEFEHDVLRAVREAPTEDGLGVVKARDRLQIVEARQQVVGVADGGSDDFARERQGPQF